MHKKTSVGLSFPHDGPLEIGQFVLKSSLIWKRIIRFGNSPCGGFGFSVIEFSTSATFRPSEDLAAADWNIDTGLDWLRPGAKFSSPLCSCGFCGSLFESRTANDDAFLDLYADIEFSFLKWDEAETIKKFERLYLALPDASLFRIERCANCRDDKSFLDYLDRKLSEFEFELWRIKPDKARAYVNFFSASGDKKKSDEWAKKLGVLTVEPEVKKPKKERKVRTWMMRKKPPAPDVVAGVYCIESGGLIKVGLSTNIKSRVSSIRGANPTARLLRVIETEEMGEVEKKMHIALASKHYDREWFSATESDFIEAAIKLGHQPVQLSL